MDMADALLGFFDEIEAGQMARFEYEPPYESPIEDILAWHLVKYLHNETVLTPQVPIGDFRVDFLIERSGRRVVIECDGKDYHNYERDRRRDFQILSRSDVDVIYRFKGADIHFGVEHLLFHLSEQEPQIFSGRGIANLRVLTAGRRNFCGLGEDGFYIEYADEEGHPFLTKIICRRREARKVN